MICLHIFHVNVVCATNCPNNAIKPVKVRDNIPTEKHKIGTKTFLELV